MLALCWLALANSAEPPSWAAGGAPIDPELTSQLPTGRALKKLFGQLVIAEADRPKIRTTYSAVDCYALEDSERVLCEAEVVKRIRPEHCAVQASGSILCTTTWCEPCQSVGLRTTLTLVDGAWRASAAVVGGGPPHGCGFGCYDEF